MKPPSTRISLSGILGVAGILLLLIPELLYTGEKDLAYQAMLLVRVIVFAYIVNSLGLLKLLKGNAPRRR